jgi:DNA-binding MarR family transcriptional regulator
MCDDTYILIMPQRLRDEIKQTKPFGSLEQEALLSIARTAAVLEHAMGEELKAHGITPTQFNVLRILRGAGAGGLSRQDVRERMISPVADCTRLLDRLDEMGLVTRERDLDDRRVVTTRITQDGLQLLAALDRPVADFHRRQLGHMDARSLQQLVDLLAVAREGL